LGISEDVISYYPEHKGLHTEACGATILIYRPGHAVASDGMKFFVDDAARLLGLFKEGVRELKNQQTNDNINQN
jgi:hypothetical protein